ncbi:hypothetical protein HWV62_6061 [Athelia sp. TMB]|nr:hypothetical protein HWV62_6061 [Athelia sp. TMB]
MNPDIEQSGLDFFGADLQSQWKLAMPPLYLDADKTLLNSHTVASSLDMRISQHAIASLKSQLEGMDAFETTLKRLDEEIPKLRQRCNIERVRAEEALRCHQSVVAPIKRVSDDILVEIFFAFMDTGDWRFQPNPINLTSICGRWRTLAQSVPRLWTRITALLTPSNHSAMGNLIFHYASLSATQPVKFSLKSKEESPSPAVASCYEPDGTGEDDQLLSQAIVASAPRWEKVTVTPSALPFLRRAWLSVDESEWDVASLEILEIEEVHPDEIWPYDDDMDMFSTAPKLRHIICPSDGPSIPLEIPWDQIEQSDGFSMSTVEFSKYLRRCPNLVRCSISLFDSCDELDTHQHQALRSITAHVDPRLCLGEFFIQFQLPSLVELRLEAFWGLPIWQQHHFATFLAQSSCILQRMTISGDLASTKDLLLIFGSVPSLSELQIDERIDTYMEAEAYFDTEIIEKLTLNSQSPSATSRAVLLPCLKTLSLLGGLRFNTRAFTEMIKSRTIYTNQDPSVFQNLYVQIEKQQTMEEAGRTVRNYEPTLSVQDFKDVQEILGERAFISVVQMTSPDLAFPCPL